MNEMNIIKILTKRSFLSHKDMLVKYFLFRMTDDNISKAVFNPIALRKAKIVCNFGFSECSRVKRHIQSDKR